ncbi:MAG: 2-hydroxychromene-2-carboxylate isomerase [Alphaproteobacteria bacterium]|nr:MAG: 2-hydroxychromene-2-carboxylate isomerase [Alphaproteobacteria bacterium]
MVEAAEVYVYFNFRSPYCYLASKNMFRIFEQYHARMVWRPLGGWGGRSAPERAKKKMPIVRQDVRRHARRLGIPFNPPPITTDPTPAGAGSLLAESEGLLRPYIVEVMRKEWGEGKDIGDLEVLLEVGEEIGLPRGALSKAIESEANLQRLEDNWAEAQERGAFGVPTFIIGQDIFWGNDRIDFVCDHLRELGLRRL